jgi:hypothetical protein
MMVAVRKGKGTQAVVYGRQHKTRIGGNTVYILFAAPALSLAAIFAVTLRNQFASRTDL